MDLGRARHRITFTAQAAVRTASGDLRDEWQPLHTVWAAPERLGGAEAVAAQQRSARHTTRWRVRASSELAGVTSAHRIEWTDRFVRRVFEIKSVAEDKIGELVIVADELTELGARAVP